MKSNNHHSGIFALFLIFVLNSFFIFGQKNIDETAEKMLLFQRLNGGWPQYNGDPTNYKNQLTEEYTVKLKNDKSKNDATIDDNSTTGEINYLMNAYQTTKNSQYKTAAQNGIRYLLISQNNAGGWPQKYPDTSGYHVNITYNDEAMISVLWIMKKVTDKRAPFEKVDRKLKRKCETALKNGIECILNTQYIQNGQLTAWCAQHNPYTLKPASARAFEPASLSGKETVGIMQFLKSLNSDDPRIKTSFKAAEKWLNQVKLKDLKLEKFSSEKSPKGYDLKLVPEPGNNLWARFYDLETNEPLFIDRRKIRLERYEDLEVERRTGYAYLGTWPEVLFEK